MGALKAETTIINGNDIPYVEVPLPGVEDVQLKVLRADEENDVVVAMIKFGANARMPRHYHHCRAVAYTLKGCWEYDEGSFRKGWVAYEEQGNVHTPSSDEGSELFLVFMGDNGRYLDNYMEDGTILRIGMPLFKAMEAIQPEELANVPVLDLIEVIPPDNATD